VSDLDHEKHQERARRLALEAEVHMQAIEFSDTIAAVFPGATIERIEKHGPGEVHPYWSVGIYLQQGQFRQIKLYGRGETAHEACMNAIESHLRAFPQYPLTGISPN
jgi:hypothetical protein